MSHPLLAVNHLTHLYAPGKGFSDVSLNCGPVKCWVSWASPARENHSAESPLGAPGAAGG